MKINELLSENELDEIDRRGFLKGLGAAAGLAAVGNVAAAPFQKSIEIDKMSGEKTEYRDLNSDDGKGALSIIPNRAVILVLKKGRTFVRDFGSLHSVRIKLGNNAPFGVTATGGGRNEAQLGVGNSKGPKDLANDILKHKGPLLIEVTLDDGKKDIIKFTID